MGEEGEAGRGPEERADAGPAAQGAPARSGPAPADGGPQGPAAAGAGPPAADEDVETLRRKAAERDEFLDLLRRTKADFANYQKRVEEERKRWGAMAQMDLLAKLLAASDQCRVAARQAEKDDSAESMRDAICLVWSEVEKFMRLAGVSVIPTVGGAFDPERHEAVSVSRREDVPDSTIVAEVAPGYVFGDLLLRPAKVVVAKRARPPESEAPAERETGAGEPDRA